MKYVKLKTLPLVIAKQPAGTISTAWVLETVLGEAPSGTNLAAMRQRMKILDLIDDNKDPDTLALNEAQHAILSEAAQSFPFRVSARALVEILEDIVGAADTPPHVLTESNVKPNTQEATNVPAL